MADTPTPTQTMVQFAVSPPSPVRAAPLMIVPIRMVVTATHDFALPAWLPWCEVSAIPSYPTRV